MLHGKGGSWQEHAIVPARQVVPVPSSLPVEQAACFFVNPASAFIMTRSVLRVPRVLAIAINGRQCRAHRDSAGQHYSFRTINVVRRREQAEELRLSAKDAVICSQNTKIDERVMELTKGEGVQYAIKFCPAAYRLSPGHFRSASVVSRLRNACRPMQFDSRC